MTPLEQATSSTKYVEPAPITADRARRARCRSSMAASTVRVWRNLGRGRRALSGRHRWPRGGRRPTSRIRSTSIDRGRSRARSHVWRQEVAVHASAAWLVDRRRGSTCSCSAARRSSEVEAGSGHGRRLRRGVPVRHGHLCRGATSSACDGLDDGFNLGRRHHVEASRATGVSGGSSGSRAPELPARRSTARRRHRRPPAACMVGAGLRVIVLS